MSKYCPKCGGDSYIVDGRNKKYGYRRRRECELCGFRWSTLEIVIESGCRLRNGFDISRVVDHNNIL